MSDTPIYDETVGALLVDDPMRRDVDAQPTPGAPEPMRHGRHHLRTPPRRLLPGEPALSGLQDPFHDLTERTAMAPPDQHNSTTDDLDTGDLIDPLAADPTPDEITDPAHPDYVEPWSG